LGNRLQQQLTGGSVSIGTTQLVVDPATNRISGFTYDNAGNMTHDATAAYTFDGANRLTKINGGPPTYTYIGPLRIKKVVGGTTATYVYSGTKPIAEYVGGSLSREYIYAGRQLLATIAGANTTYHHPDHLSNRAETDSTGTVTRSFGHFPFGEAWYEPSATDKLKFTSYENDSGTGETGLNYAISRYHASGQGRFIGADPVAGRLDAPQSLNRYEYAMNDPVNAVDPAGLAPMMWMCTTPMRNIWWTDGGDHVHIGKLIDNCKLVALVPWGSPDWANTLKKKLKNFGKSHCNDVFNAVIAGYSTKDFLKSVDSTNTYDIPSSDAPLASFTQDDVSGNGNGTSLFRTVSGHVAVTISNGTRPAIILGPDFFMEDKGTQGNDLVHEELHAYTGWNDQEIFDAFSDYGLEHKNRGTSDISNWIANDCTRTP
jgi:RHS repeat-associated protein